MRLFFCGWVGKDPYVLCRIFEKSGSGPKNGEKYGAPLGDKEWENDNVVDPLPVAVDDDDGPLKVVPASAVNATAAAASAVDDDDHLETADLEKVCIVSQMMWDSILELELEFQFLCFNVNGIN